MRLKAKKYKRRNEKETIYLFLFSSRTGRGRGGAGGGISSGPIREGRKGCDFISSFHRAMLTSPSPLHGSLSLSLSEVERWIASLFHSLRWSREAGRPGLTGAVEG